MSWYKMAPEIDKKAYRFLPGTYGSPFESVAGFEFALHAMSCPVSDEGGRGTILTSYFVLILV
jgi:hypothetical protein